jgi:hypothetical protein
MFHDDGNPTAARCEERAIVEEKKKGALMCCSRAPFVDATDHPAKALLLAA